MIETDFALPPATADFPPAFLTPVACHDWLATVPMANPTQAQAMLLRQLNLLYRYSLPVRTLHSILEALRATVSDVQDDVAKRFAGKPLPFAPAEQAALDASLAVWQAQLKGYLRCLEAAAWEVELAPLRAQLAQRALSVFACWQVDLCRGERLPEPEYWRLLNRTLQLTEAIGVLHEAVDDPVRHGNARTTPLAACGEVHLLHMASPFELPQRHLNWIARWARRWGGKLTLSSTPPATGHAAPLWFDLNTAAPAGYTARNTPTGRWLDTAEVRRSVKTRLVMLEKGESPSRLQLGEDCTQPAAGQLLQRVYQRWCKGGAVRRQERRAASGGCEFIVGMEAVHYYLSGRKPFVQPVRSDNMLRKEREELATFGKRPQHQDEHFSTEHGYQVENWAIIDDWQLLDQSANGLRIARPLKDGVRVGTGQLVAVKLAGASGFVTGGVRWTLHDPEHVKGPQLAAGIQLFPGQARPVAARGAEPGNNEPFRQAFLLPAVPALQEPESLILTVGTFRLGRIIEVRVDGEIGRAVLDRVLDRGEEFERCTFHV